MRLFEGRSSAVVVMVVASGVPAFAAGVTFTCDPSVNANSYAGTCNYLNTTIAGLYNNTFTNANASIYIRSQNNNGLGGSTVGFLNLEPYATYQTALQNESTDTVAKATVPITEPGLFGSMQVELTSALVSALGLTTSNGNSPGFIAGTKTDGTVCYTPGSGGCYNGIITINDPADLKTQQSGQGYTYRTLGGSTNSTTQNYDYFSVVEHEVDEILGTASCVTTNGNVLGNQGNCVGAVDLFRYTSAGTRTFNTAGVNAYFSADGGTTDYESNTYNHLANGDDWADLSNSCTFVQDARGCLNQSFDITTDGPLGTTGPEIAILNAVGYNLQAAVPEPGTVGLLSLALAGLSAFGYRRRKGNLPPG